MKKIRESTTLSLIVSIICVVMLILTITIAVIYRIMNYQIVFLIALFGFCAFFYLKNYVYLKERIRKHLLR